MERSKERAEAFIQAIEVFRSDGNFVTTASVGVGDQITIGEGKQKDMAVIVTVIELDDGTRKVYFRWA